MTGLSAAEASTDFGRTTGARIGTRFLDAWTPGEPR
jgi:hypothetical protein